MHVQPYTLRLVQMQEAKKSLSALSLAFLPFVPTSAAKWLTQGHTSCLRKHLTNFDRAF
jgi:hypothetical protein